MRKVSNTRKIFLDKVYKIYVRWQGRPKIKLSNDMTGDQLSRARNAGVILSDQDFCDRYEVTLQEVYEFTQRETYSQDIREEAILYAKTQLPEIIATATRKAKSAKTIKDIKDWADMIEDLKRKVVDNPEEKALFERLTLEDYTRIVRREVMAYAAKGGVFDDDWSDILVNIKNKNDEYVE